MTIWKERPILSIVERTPRPKIHWDVERVTADMALRGWNTATVAREAGLSYKTVDRFLRGEIQTPKTIAKLAHALGHAVSRYLARVEGADASAPAPSADPSPILPINTAGVTR